MSPEGALERQRLFERLNPDAISSRSSIPSLTLRPCAVDPTRPQRIVLRSADSRFTAQFSVMSIVKLFSRARRSPLEIKSFAESGKRASPGSDE
jgi:hypothetical protein